MAVCAASAAHAAGFMLTEQSAGALGRAYAGAGVDGTDISGVYYNPATMTLHPGTQIQAGFVAVGLDLALLTSKLALTVLRKMANTIPKQFRTAIFPISSTTACGSALL